MENLLISSKFALLSTELQQELLDFLDYLIQKQQKVTSLPKDKEAKPLIFGELAHLGTFKMSDDFDEPLEEFNDYM